MNRMSGTMFDLNQFRFLWPIKCGCNQQNDCSYYHQKNDCPESIELILTEDKWRLHMFEEQQKKLNDCKSQLDRFDIDQWSLHTNFTDFTSKIRGEISRDSNPYHCTFMVTRAWIKLYEILDVMKLIDPLMMENNQFHGLFLCEAPGAFINATNHYIKANFHRMFSFEWLANTLNPYYENIDDNACISVDDFIQDPYHFKRWYFGPDNTGNIMQKNFDHHLRLNNVYSSKNHGTETTRFYDLITGDGAFDCQDHFDQQEELVFKIIFAEIRTGLRFLKSNRNMVVKFFTFTDCRTISLLYFLSKFFRDIICYKPIASRASNSEVYVVCRGFYHEYYQNFGEKILSTIEDIPDRMILDLEIIDNEFIENLENLNNSLFDRQMNSINRNIQLFNSMNEQNRHEIEDGKILLARQFIEHFRIVNISMNENLTISSVLTTNRRRVHKQQKFYLIKLKYSFQSNKVPEFKTIKKIFITNDYYRGQSLIFNENKLQSFRLYHCNVEQFSFGQRFDEINNSKFVCNYLLKTFIWFKSICANKVFNKRLSYKNNLVDKKFDDFLQKYLHDKTIVEGDRCSLGSLMMNHSTVDFINNNIFDKKLSESERISQVHFIDLAINNDGDGCLALNTKDFEFCTEFRAKIQNLIRIIKPNDCLVLQTKPLLSRLSVGMLLLILTRFRNFLFQTVAIGNHLRLVCILDQYCSPNDSNSELLFQKFFDISNTNYWNDSLMEIFAVPSILANHRFSEAIWIANSHYLYLLLKSITEEWGEQIEMIINEGSEEKEKEEKITK